MAKVYLALYKHKRSWLKEPLKALADAVKLQQNTRNSSAAIIMSISLCMTAIPHPYWMEAYAVSKLMYPITLNGI